MTVQGPELAAFVQAEWNEWKGMFWCSAVIHDEKRGRKSEGVCKNIFGEGGGVLRVSISKTLTDIIHSHQYIINDSMHLKQISSSQWFSMIQLTPGACSSNVAELIQAKMLASWNDSVNSNRILWRQSGYIFCFLRWSPCHVHRSYQIGTHWSISWDVVRRTRCLWHTVWHA